MEGENHQEEEITPAHQTSQLIILVRVAAIEPPLKQAILDQCSGKLILRQPNTGD